jgi:hypothetical protein
MLQPISSQRNVSITPMHSLRIADTIGVARRRLMNRQKPRPDSQVETFVLPEPSLRARFSPESYDFS